MHTSPDHFDYREVIRKTWGDPKHLGSVNSSVVFVVGRSKDLRTELKLKQEWEKFGDILQTDYDDTYQTLVLKALSWMQWISDECRQVPFILKTDDDICINIFQVAKYLELPERKSDSNLYHCLLWSRMQIIRDPKSKW